MAKIAHWGRWLSRPHLPVIALVGLIVPRRLRADWRQEWETELRYREMLLADWDRLDWRHKLDLVRRSTSAFWDALWLQRRRLEDDMFQDLRYGARMLLAHPGFTAVAVISLALGIGANTAIFSLMDAVLFRTLSVDRPDQLYFLGHDGRTLSSNYPLFERYRELPVFSGVTAYRGRTLRVATSDGVEQVPGQFVSGNYHAVVGVQMAIGRGFTSEPDRGPASLTAVISHEYWASRFGLRPDVTAQTLTINGRPIAIVGVTPRGFRGLNPGHRVDITLPMSVMALDTPQFFDDHDGWIAHVIVGRLAPNVSLDQALSATDVVFQRFVEEPPNRWVRTANRNSHRSAALVPAARGTAGLRDQYSTPLFVLMTMVAIVLLIACANVANLLLARATTRTREIAVRLSIGAGRLRLLRQLLTESLLLALLGGAAGVLIATFGTGRILSLLAGGPSPLTIDATVNVRVLAFTAAVVMLTGIGFGLVPAFRSTRLDLTSALKEGTVTLRRVRRPVIGQPLVVAQIALCVVILAAAALLSRSLANLRGFDAGFDRRNMLLANIDSSNVAVARQGLQLYLDLLGRLRQLPGVESAALSTRTPIDFSSQVRRIDVRGAPATPGQGVSSNVVTPEYFQTFGIRLVRGRGLADGDRQGAPRVAVVSASMANFYFQGGDPIGETFLLGGDKERTTIVGVVEDVRHEFLRTEVPPKMVYTALTQSAVALDGSVGVPNTLTVALRTQRPGVLINDVRREVRASSRDLLVPYVRTMEEQIDATLVPEHLLAALSGAFGAVALALACVGLYGVMSYNVGRQTREIGIRMALGAFPRTVLYGVLRDTFTIAAVGIVLGLVVALAATRTLSTFLFDLSPHDPVALVAAAGLLLAVALAAGFVPARHAATVDPVRALRNE